MITNRKVAGLAAAVLALAGGGGDRTASASGWNQLPRSGLGFRTHSSSDRQWGQTRMVNNLIGLGKVWDYIHRGRYLSFGDMSKRGGGYFPPHQTHRYGTDCDMRMLNRSAYAQSMTRWSSSYSRTYTAQLVYWMYKRGGVRVVYFNDTSIPGVRWCSGHDNHLHYGIY